MVAERTSATPIAPLPCVAGLFPSQEFAVRSRADASDTSVHVLAAIHGHVAARHETCCLAGDERNQCRNFFGAT